MNLARGFLDSIHVIRAVQFCRSTKNVLDEFYSTMILNFAIAFGSMYFWKFVMYLHFQLFQYEIESWQLLLARDVFWTWPLSILCLGFNILYNRNLAIVASHSLKVRPNNNNFLIIISEEIYRIILSTCLYIQLNLMDWCRIKWFQENILFSSLINIMLYFQLAIYFSMFCFEYKWSFIGWTLDDRLDTIEYNWMYFLGFGALQVVLFKLLPANIFACFVPCFILLAILSRFEKSEKINIKNKIPIFWGIRALVTFCLVKFQKYFAVTR